MSGHYRWQGADLVLHCHIQPRASRTDIDGLHGDRLKIRLAAPPVDGRANDQLTRYLADAFGVARSQVSLVRGETSRSKTVLIRAPQQLPPSARVVAQAC